MNSKTNTVRAILLDATECDRPEADHPATIEICADDLQRILERHITEPAQCLHQIAEPTQVVEAQDLYYLQDARHHAMVGNCPSFWREGGGYTTNLDEAELFTLEAAMKQHKSRETDLPWLCADLDKLRRPTIDCQYMPRSWDEQRAYLASQPNGEAA